MLSCSCSSALQPCWLWGGSAGFSAYLSLSPGPASVYHSTKLFLLYYLHTCVQQEGISLNCQLQEFHTNSGCRSFKVIRRFYSFNLRIRKRTKKDAGPCHWHLTLLLHSFKIPFFKSSGAGKQFWGDCLCLILSSQRYFVFILFELYLSREHIYFFKYKVVYFGPVVTLRLSLRQCQIHIS